MTDPEIIRQRQAAMDPSGDRLARLELKLDYLLAEIRDLKALVSAQGKMPPRD